MELMNRSRAIKLDAFESMQINALSLMRDKEWLWIKLDFDKGKGQLLLKLHEIQFKHLVIEYKQLKKEDIQEKADENNNSVG